MIIKMITNLEKEMDNVYRNTGKMPSDGYSVTIKIIEDEFDAFTEYLNELGYFWDVEGNRVHINVYEEDKRVTEEEYKGWLRDTIQNEIPYNLDPAVGVVTEDLNHYFQVDYSWEEWNEYYIENLDYIEWLENELTSN